MGAALAVAGLVGSGISAIGGMQSAEAQKQNMFYQAAVAANNAQVAKENAEMEIQTGQAAAGMQGLKNRSVLGAMKAGQAASGVDVNTGSFVNSRVGTAEIGALNQATILSNASKKAWGFNVQATNDLVQSQMDIRGGQQIASAAPLAAFGSLLSGASSVGARYSGYQNQTDPFGGFAGFGGAGGAPTVFAANNYGGLTSGADVFGAGAQYGGS